jgi:CBS domain-containing protein
MLHYKVIEIFTSEEARWKGKVLYSAVVERVNDLKIAARCLVTRGIEGSYESGEIATGRLEILSYNMPVRITIIMPAAEFDTVLAQLEEIVVDGIIAVRDVEVVSHKTRGLLIPRQTRVRDIMTSDPKTVGTATPVSEVVRLLLSSAFNGVPVVDAKGRPVGVIAQGDLVYKADLPMRLGLLAESDRQKIDEIMETLSRKAAGEVMTKPPVCIEKDRLVTEAVDVMLKKNVKRLPVIDKEGKLVGIVSRVDIFRTVMSVCPDWGAFQEKNIRVEGLRHVSDIMRRDTLTVLPGTPVEEVIGVINCSDIQRVCVVDKEGHFLGLISDRDLLSAFSNRYPGIRDYFMARIPFTERARRHRELGSQLRAKTASEVMKTSIVTVREDTTIEEAICFMLEKSIKSLPVLDSDGKFKGMISRDSLLRTIFASS